MGGWAALRKNKLYLCRSWIRLTLDCPILSRCIVVTSLIVCPLCVSEKAFFTPIMNRFINSYNQMFDMTRLMYCYFT